MKFNKEFLIAVFGDNSPTPVIIEPKRSEAEVHERYIMTALTIFTVGIITCFLNIQLGLVVVGIAGTMIVLSKDVNEK